MVYLASVGYIGYVNIGYFKFEFKVHCKNLWNHLVSVGKFEWQNLVKKSWSVELFVKLCPRPK